MPHSSVYDVFDEDVFQEDTFQMDGLIIGGSAYRQAESKRLRKLSLIRKRDDEEIIAIIQMFLKTRG